MSVSHAPPDSDQADTPDTADTHNGSPDPGSSGPLRLDAELDQGPRLALESIVPGSARLTRAPVRLRRTSGPLPQARDFPLTHVIVVCLIVLAFLGPLADFIVRSLERLLPQWRPTFTGR